MQQSKERSVNITVPMPVDLKEKLAAHAKREDRTICGAVRAIIREALDRKPQG